MFEVCPAETAEPAAAHRLPTVLNSERPDLHGRGGAWWSSLVFQAEDSLNALGRAYFYSSSFPPVQ
ncbi:hypothetical protein GCM10010433_58440 [Streptomyces pulveraceus]